MVVSDLFVPFIIFSGHYEFLRFDSLVTVDLNHPPALFYFCFSTRLHSHYISRACTSLEELACARGGLTTGVKSRPPLQDSQPSLQLPLRVCPDVKWVVAKQESRLDDKTSWELLESILTRAVLLIFLKIAVVKPLRLLLPLSLAPRPRRKQGTGSSHRAFLRLQARAN